MRRKLSIGDGEPILETAARTKNCFAMDRPTFFRPAARPSLSDPSVGPPFEFMPGQFADLRMPVKWGYQADHGDPEDDGRTRNPLRIGGGLEPYVPTAEAPWNESRAYHLLRRTGFSPTLPEAATVLGNTPGAAVDAIVDAALSTPLPSIPTWYDNHMPLYDAPDEEWQIYIEQNIGWLEETRDEVIRELLVWRTAGTNLREKLALFWHNHFVTGLESYFHAPWLYRYWALLRTHGLGDFKQFVHDMGTSPAMLIYLNGVENRVGNPNENYARELLELFTMGISGPGGSANYTQTDIAELARALTGWGIDVYGTQEAVLVPQWHDYGQKTIFGQTDNFGYDDIVPLLFNQRGVAIAHFVCRELYQEFVYPFADEDIVAAMADILIANDYQIEPVVRTLLKSAHFFDAATIGARVKSPAELFLGECRAAEFVQQEFMEEYLYYFCYENGQRIFDPPNVSGWPGHRAWIDTSTLSFRWLFCEGLLYQEQTLQSLALSFPQPFNAARLTEDIAAYLLAVPLDQELIDSLIEVLLDGLPDYEWDPLNPGAEGRLFGLFNQIFRLPEYQLA